jgi:hypothetical protein
MTYGTPRFSDETEMARKILSLANIKLRGRLSESRESDSLSETQKLACIAVRFPLDFRITREANLKAAFLVEQHMRVAFGVHANRKVLDSGSPSEPVLVEASSQIFPLSAPRSRDELSPLGVLARASSQQWLAKGERGEMMGRFLWLAARDAAVQALDKTVLMSPDGLRYHRPVKLLDILEHLFAPDVWNEVRSARPVGLKDGKPGPTLEYAFRNAWTTYTHFSRASDSKVIQLPHLSHFLVRGVALQCADNQKHIDNLSPVHFEKDFVMKSGSALSSADKRLLPQDLDDMAQMVQAESAPTVDNDDHSAKLVKPLDQKSSSHWSYHEFTQPICSENTSAVLSQIKNRTKALDDVNVGPTVICPEGNSTHPILVIVMELGVQNPTCRVQVKTNDRSSRSGTSEHHNTYHITVYGATSATYRVIPDEDNDRVASLLAATPFFEGFPRQGTAGCLAALRRMKPVFEDGAEAMDWVSSAPGHEQTPSPSTTQSVLATSGSSSSDLGEPTRKKQKIGQ